tara:strand:- start:1738 stop:2745 length:1008 start_codon:yes stop_codon:yes gene_type:complete
VKKTDLSYFCCLNCKGDLFLKAFDQENEGEVVKEGVLFCLDCKTYYPLSGEIPFLIDSGYYEFFDLNGFIKKWGEKFEFGSHKLLDSNPNVEKLKQVNFFNSNPGGYDDDVSHSNFWVASDWNVLSRWLNEIPESGTVLDMGCGTGRVTIPLAQGGRHVISTDISIGMLREAKNKILRHGLGYITFFLADAEALPIKPNLCSTTISFGLLHHVEEPGVIIRDVLSLLKEGGAFYALENHTSPVRFIFDWLMKLNQLWVEEAGSHPTFKIREVEDMITKNGMKAEVDVSTFLPPHLFNCMSQSLGKKFLLYTDTLFNSLPLFRNLGGQLVIKAEKV